MSELNPERLAHLRTLLNDPAQRADEIIEYLQAWPEHEGKQIAQSYADAYFTRHATEDALEAIRSKKMYFDPTTRHLYTCDGQLIKQLSCPETMCWDELERVQTHDFKRFCGSCDKHVVNTAGLTDEQVVALVQYDPSVCLYINEAHGNVMVAQATDQNVATQSTIDNRHIGITAGLRVIKTARTQREVEHARARGFWPLPRAVESSNGHIGAFIQVWQHKQTGELCIQRDIRYPGFQGDYDEWEVAVPGFNYDASNHFPEPVAAYLLPPDITVGERVLLDDLIENFVGSTHHGSTRLDKAEAIWTGSTFEIQYNEQKDIVHYLG